MDNVKMHGTTAKICENVSCIYLRIIHRLIALLIYDNWLWTVRTKLQRNDKSHQSTSFAASASSRCTYSCLLTL
jgi:hypothetical protein